MAGLFLFYLSAGVTVAGALAVVALPVPMYSVLSLIAAFLGLAGLYLSLGAEFVAAVQVIVYAGAIMVLFLFVVMLLDMRREERKPLRMPVQKLAGAQGPGRRGQGQGHAEPHAHRRVPPEIPEVLVLAASLVDVPRLPEQKAEGQLKVRIVGLENDELLHLLAGNGPAPQSEAPLDPSLELVDTLLSKRVLFPERHVILAGRADRGRQWRRHVDGLLGEGRSGQDEREKEG